MCKEKKEGIRMFGIYVYENGLRFTGKIAKTEEEAKKYLGQTYGKIEKVYAHKRDENNCPIYEEKFVPNYNKNAFVIKKLETI